jgi:hypothetical protein
MKTITVLVIAGLCASIDAGAQTGAAWNFTGSSANANTTGANITATAVTMGPDVTGGAQFSGADFFGQDGWPATTTIDANAYMQFTVTPGSGYYLQLTSMSVALRHSSLGTTSTNPASNGSGPASFQLRSSVDNYVSVLASGTLLAAYTTFPVTLPANFPGVNGAVTFRLYGYNEFMTSGGSNRFVTDQITVTGSAVPGTLATQSIDLSAAASGQAVDLQWQTIGFGEGTTFSLQRSTDGAQFTNLESVSGNTAVDNTVTAGQWFYRLEAQSTDGSSYFSPIVTVMVNGNSATTATIRGVSAQGNLVRTFLHLPDAGTYQLSIRTMDGQPLYRTEMSGETGDITTDIGFGTRAHGVYVVTLVGSGATSSREFFY